jgi:glycine cleavage system H protein
MYPDTFRYTKDHEWIKVEGGQGLIGITDFAQNHLGDIIYIELPQVGAKLAAHQALGVVESVKSVSDVYAPVAGEVVAVNDALAQASDIVNKDPHGQGWFVRMKLADAKEVDGLMTAADYEKYLEGLEV